MIVVFDGAVYSVAFDLPARPRHKRAMAPRFLCDAMLGGLSRWLRAAGYDATFDGTIEDGALVRRAAEEKRILLSSDSGVFERNALRRGDVRGIFVPRATPPVEQLAFVLRALDLAILEPRCMACGGDLREIAKRDAAGRVPPRSFAAFDRFWTCSGCSKLFWHGTHWTRIRTALTASIPRPRAARS